MIYFEIKNFVGKILASNMNACPVLNEFSGLEKESRRIKNLRNVYRENEAGSVRLIVVNDQDLYNSNRMVNRIMNVYFDLLPQLKEIEKHQRQYFDLIISRYNHNLITVQSKLKGHLQRLTSDRARESTYHDFQKEVQRRITGNTATAADDIIQVSHRVADLDAQIDGLRIISGFAEKTKPSFVNTSIRKILLRLHHPFVQELEKRKVHIKIQIPQEISDRNKIRMDPQLFNVAMWQFFNNATKYVRPETDIVFTANLEKSPRVICCEMISLQVEDDEKQKIFDEKYKGKNAKDIVGDGIGMFMIKKSLGLMGASITIDPDYSTSEFLDDKKYCKNIFLFEFAQH